MSGFSITTKTKDAEIVRLPLDQRRLAILDRVKDLEEVRNNGVRAATIRSDYGKTLEQRKSDLDNVIYFDTLASKYKKFRQSLGD